MPSATGSSWEKYKKNFADDEIEEKKITPLTDEDIQVLKTYGAAPYGAALKKLEQQIKEKQQSVDEKIGVKESDTGLAPPHLWDVAADRQRMSEEQPLQVARCTKIIPDEKDESKSKYVINVKQIAKFVVQLGERVSPTDIEEGMRVGVDRNKYQILLPLPPKIDASVTMMTVEEKPDVTYGDVGGCKEQVEKLREVVEMPLLSPERFGNLGIDPPKGALLYGPPGTGKTLCRVPWPTGQTPPSSASSVASWSRNMWAKAPGWCASYSRWRGRRRRASSSSTKSMPSAAHVLTTAPAAITKCRERC